MLRNVTAVEVSKYIYAADELARRSGLHLTIPTILRSMSELALNFVSIAYGGAFVVHVWAHRLLGAVVSARARAF